MQTIIEKKVRIVKWQSPGKRWKRGVNCTDGLAVAANYNERVKIGKRKETEIIALRTKNGELQRKNDILAKDNSDLYAELKKHEKTATTNDGAVRLLKTLLEYAPEELATAKQAASRRQEQEREKNPSRGNSNNKFKGK